MCVHLKCTLLTIELKLTVYISQIFWLSLTPTDTEAYNGAVGHIILTPANQLMVMGLKTWSLSHPGANQRHFDHWPTSLPTALTGPTETFRYCDRTARNINPSCNFYAYVTQRRFWLFIFNTQMCYLC
jgi:hypothetical protein